MTQYAREADEQLVAPTDAEFRGVINWRQHDPVLRSRGYLPIANYPEAQEGKRIVLDTWEKVTQSEIRKEPRQVMVEDWEDLPDPEHPGQTIHTKTGEHQEMQEQDITYDTSYWNITAFHYEDIPAPPEPPAPDTTERDNAEKAIVAAIKALADKYDAVSEIALLMYDGSLTIPALMELAGTKGVPDAELGALITELTPYKWQLEAVTGLLWADAWDELKSRFPSYWSEIILDQMEQQRQQQ